MVATEEMEETVGVAAQTVEVAGETGDAYKAAFAPSGLRTGPQ
jgi:hypothetical protein